MSLEQPVLEQEAQIAASPLNWSLPGAVGLFALHFVFCLGLLWFNAEFTPDIYNVILDADVNRSFEEVAVGVFLALIPLLSIPRRLELPSEVFAYLLYLAVYLPFCTVGLQSIAAPLGTLLPYIVICAIALITMFSLARAAPRRIVREGRPLSQVYWGLILGSFAVILLAATTIGIDLKPLALEDIYELRLLRRDQFGSGNFLFLVLGYLISPMNLIMGPAIVQAGFTRDRAYMLLVGAVITYASYQTSGQKDALGACFIALTATFVWGSSSSGQFSFPTWRVVTTFLAFMVLSPLIDEWRDDPGRLLSQLTVSRLFVIPGMLGGFWVEFFSENPHGYYAGTGVLGLLFGREEVYGIPLARMIGLVYGGNEESNANVNMFAEGYAQAGLLGVVIASIIAIVALRLLDRVAVDRDARILLPLCVPLAFALTNGHILGLILTNGLWALIVLAYFLPRRPGTPL